MNLPPTGLRQDEFQLNNQCFTESYLESEGEMFEEESTLMIEETRFRSYEEVLGDPDLADEMFPPDYFQLVE